MSQDHIRNFCIIAHIDHGKSTLADRLLELTGTVEKRQMRDQVLDKMDLERERGITIKLAPVRMHWSREERSNSSLPTPHSSLLTSNQIEYELNLIDTPGHVDFSYEVSRSLAACEGAVLVVDATQGIQAQTLANVHLAKASGLKIIPVLNKIDLPAADTGRVSQDIMNLLNCTKESILLVSAKTGQGVEKVLDRVIKDVPSPSGKTIQPTRALIFDSYYDTHRGVVLYVRIVDGKLDKGESIKMMATKSEGIALEVGRLVPQMSQTKTLQTGEIGYIVTNLKSSRDANVGDTVTVLNNSAQTALAGYKDVKPFVYAGFFPADANQYQTLKEGIEKLALSDSALAYELENSPVLGFGVRIGFLGLLHMDIVRERLTREYGLDLIVTNPSTEFRLQLTTGEEVVIKTASDMPDPAKIQEIREPWMNGEIICPSEFVGAIIQLIVSSRGSQTGLDFVGASAIIGFEAPLASVLTHFYDSLKSLTSGYGSLNYDLADYRPGDLVRLDFYVGGEKVDALSAVVPRSEAEKTGREVVAKLKEVIPKQSFAVSLQAGIGGRFVAREDISAYRKDVTTGLYGGDVSRKKKVLAKQAKGKKRMKRFGKVDIPAEAFTVLLKRD